MSVKSVLYQSGEAVSTEADRLRLVGARIDAILAQVPDPCTPAQLARAMGFDPRSIRRFCETRELPGTKEGKRWKISHAAIRYWIVNNTNGALVA
jgi:Helix-turn-helix domain